MLRYSRRNWIRGGRDKGHSTGRLSIAPFIGLVLLAVSGCKNHVSDESTATPPSQVSAVMVRSEADGIHLQTPSAEFVLMSSGYLKSSLKLEGRILTMDDANGEPGQSLTAPP